MRRHSTPYLKSGALSEDAIQRQAAAFLRLALQSSSRVIWTHVPNGGKRPHGAGGMMKGFGARAGFPDLLFMWARGAALRRIAVGLIEIKSTDGEPSAAQLALMCEANAAGALTAICRSAEEIEGTLRAWLPPGTLRATLMPGGGIRQIEPEPLPHGTGGARDVAPGQPWPFIEHRTLAEAGVRDFSGGAGAS